MKNRSYERPCVVFAGLDVRQPEAVADFLYWLWHWNWPGEETNQSIDLKLALKEWEDDLKANPWKAVESTWGLQAPRKRMARLLWQLLQDADEQEFHRRFTAALHHLTRDAQRCGEVLPPIQQQLRWVMEGLEAADHETVRTGQASWGETWYLPSEQARYVREQLAKARLDLLEKESDYQNAVRIHLDYLVREVCKLLDPPSRDPDRAYVGEILQHEAGGAWTFVWVEGTDGRYPLPNARSPHLHTPGTNMAWGYWGSGSNHLALSILADATDGNLELARRFLDAFLDEAVALSPRDRPMRISRSDVLTWLQARGVSGQEIAQGRERLERQRAPYKPLIDRWTTVAQKELCAQRVDLVPPDFECALYLDFVDMIQSGGRVLQCSRCGLPISYDGSPRSNRQRVRWLKGQPIYHPWCFEELKLERKRVSWHQRAQDPGFRERRRHQARERRRLR